MRFHATINLPALESLPNVNISQRGNGVYDIEFEGTGKPVLDIEALEAIEDATLAETFAMKVEEQYAKMIIMDRLSSPIREQPKAVSAKR